MNKRYCVFIYIQGYTLYGRYTFYKGWGVGTVYLSVFIFLGFFLALGFGL